MRIAVIIPSRERAIGLAAVITSLDMLASGKNEITYGVCADEDDPPTKLFALGIQARMPDRIAVRVGPRPQSLGALVNDMALRLPADAYCSITDDILCLTPAWDEEIRAKIEETPHGVFWWRNALEQDSLFAVVSDAWRQAAGGIFTNYYPFWFDDWALAELWTLATGREPLRLNAQIADKPRHTHRLRDIPFWQSFYIFTRAERVRWARDIAAKLGLPEPLHAEAMADRLNAALHAMDAEAAKRIELQGDTEAPDAAYVATKVRAENMMREAA